MKKIYFDWAHLQNILEVVDTPKIEKLFKENYICFSFNHLADLSHGQNSSKVNDRAKKLDQIPNKLFLKDADGLQVMEIVRALEQEIIGYQIVPDSVFISGEFAFLFDLNKFQKSEDKEYILANQTFEQYCIDVSGLDGAKLIDNLFNQSKIMSTELAIDRKNVIQNNLTSQLGLMRNYKNRINLTSFIGQAILLLNLYGLPISNYFYKDGHVLIKVGEKLHSLNNHFMITSKLTFYHLFNEYLYLKGDALSLKKVNSKKFQKTQSDITDYGHLHALISCDYVTCDNLNYELLIKAAEKLKINIPNLKKINELLD